MLFFHKPSFYCRDRQWKCEKTQTRAQVLKKPPHWPDVIWTFKKAQDREGVGVVFDVLSSKMQFTPIGRWSLHA